MLSYLKYAGIACSWLLFMPLANTQTILDNRPSKWEFGMRLGAGFTLLRYYDYFPNGHLQSQSEYSLGGYATRHFNKRWSLRTEFSIVSQPQSFNAAPLAIGVFPRYRVVNWLSVEAGLEARKSFGGLGSNSSRLSLGAVVHSKLLDFDLRFTPSYTPSTRFTCGGWLGGVQAGVSLNLSKL